MSAEKPYPNVPCKCTDRRERTPYVRKTMKPDPELDRWIAKNRSTVSRIPRHLTLGPKKAEESRRAAAGRDNINSPSAFSKLRGIVSRRTTTTREEYHWHHHSSPCAQHRPLAQQLMKVHHGLQMGEVESVLGGSDYWPEEWGWRAVSHYRDPEHRYTADVWLKLRDFPVQLQTGIPWGPGDQEGKEVLERPAAGRRWRRTLFWKDPREEPAWKATIEVTGKDAHELLDLDPRELILFENIYTPTA
ncbi:hypothetical protein CPLU01_13567 [Colletotrichum plurivorum]|uniref:Uncharacterized protein n=1 Tax=Colletotrichum plurivorum TaxID=2175906 RepID=A0A8H6JR59_9PEZI|nr:hypothetical protein CPLU01_13567 [Colletotrichum plurivorum]